MKIKSVQINGLIYLEAKAIMKAFNTFSQTIGVPEENALAERVHVFGRKISREFVNGDFPAAPDIKEVEKEISKKSKSKKKMGRHAKGCACPKHKAKVEVAPVATKNGKEKEAVAA